MPWPRICAGCQLEFHVEDHVDAISVASERVGEEVICEDCYVERKALVARLGGASQTTGGSHKSLRSMASVRSLSPVHVEPADIYGLTRNRLLYHEDRHFYREMLSESPGRMKRPQSKRVHLGRDSPLTKKLINSQLGTRIGVQTTDGIPFKQPSPKWKPNTLSTPVSPTVNHSESPPSTSIVLRSGSRSATPIGNSLSYTERWRRRKTVTPPAISHGVRNVAAPSPLPLKEVGSEVEYTCKPLGVGHWKYQLFEKSLKGLTKRRGGVVFSLAGVTDVSCPLLDSDYHLRHDDEEYKERTVFHGTHERLFPSIFTHGLVPPSHPENPTQHPTLDPSAIHLSSDISTAALHANYESQPLPAWSYSRATSTPSTHPYPTTVKVLGLKLLTPRTASTTVTWRESTGEWDVKDPTLLLPQFILTLKVDVP